MLIVPEPQEPFVQIPTSSSTSVNKPHISFINASVYQRACKLQEAILFQLLLSVSQELTGRARQVGDDSHDLSKVPINYHQYAEVFSKERSKQLPPYHPYDLFIQLESKKIPSLGLIYLLSTLELQTLREFIDENLHMGFIQPSQSSCGTPVLFIKKKNSLLRLCVDYQGLNQLTQKDRYSILLLTDLLNASKRAQIYTKIDLWNTYHLVQIIDGNKWKMTFHTRYDSYE